MTKRTNVVPLIPTTQVNHQSHRGRIMTLASKFTLHGEPGGSPLEAKASCYSDGFQHFGHTTEETKLGQQTFFLISNQSLE